MNRRIFLRGLGGACVAAPFLGSLGQRGAKAQASTPPKRLIAMFTHYGCVTTRFFPANAHGALTASDLAPTTLRHLTPYLDRLLIPRGIRGMNEWTADLSRGQGNDQHTQVCGSYFTCHPVTPNSDEPFSFAEATKFLAKPTGPSLDHVIAEQLSPNAAPILLRVGGKADLPQSAVSYSGAETQYTGFGSPAELFTSLTGLFEDGEPMSPDSYAAVKGKSVLDLVADDLATLERFDMSQADRNKLEAWKALLDQTGTILGSAQCNAEVAAMIGAREALFDATITAGEDGDVLSSKVLDTEWDGADVNTAVAVLAAVCNANPVIVLKYPSLHVYKGLGVNYEHHALSHRITNPNSICSEGVLDMLLTIDDFHARKFARLVELLSTIDEGDAKLIDGTAAVWFQEMSDGNAHNLNNLPIVQAGSLSGYFKTGWAVNVDDGDANLSSGSSEAGCLPSNPAPGTTITTGTSATLANAPINKYFCNLMNALGVKAGPSGFPERGGTAEVTRFGRYDRTEDFIGGGTAPAMIHDPGEFTALKANA